VDHFNDKRHVLILLTAYQLSSSIPNLSALEFGQSSDLLNTAPNPVDTLTLARNARTSPEMIDRFYAAPLQGEMNVGELQSKRRPRPWE